MEDVELGLKEAGLIPEMTAELIFVKALNDNFQVCIPIGEEDSKEREGR